MTTLPQEAYAVIEGRHSDPFHYLGLHVEGDKPVVRAFVPDAEEVVEVVRAVAPGGSRAIALTSSSGSPVMGRPLKAASKPAISGLVCSADGARSNRRAQVNKSLRVPAWA